MYGPNLALPTTLAASARQMLGVIFYKLALFLDGKKPTLPETNIFAPKNGWLEYYFPIGEAYFQGRSVSFREGNLLDVSLDKSPEIGDPNASSFQLHHW